MISMNQIPIYCAGTDLSATVTLYLFEAPLSQKLSTVHLKVLKNLKDRSYLQAKIFCLFLTCYNKGSINN